MKDEQEVVRAVSNGDIALSDLEWPDQWSLQVTMIYVLGLPSFISLEWLKLVFKFIHM